MTKKSFWSRLAGFLYGLLKGLVQILVSAAKGLGGAIWKGLKWLGAKLKQGAKAAKAAHAESKRPKTQATYSALRPVKTAEGSLFEFEKTIYSKKSSIGLILGARGSGKSALGIRVLENASAKTNRKVYAIGFDRLTLPKWLNTLPAENIPDAPNGSFLLVDENGISFSSRSSMSNANKLLSELLLISRHKDLSVLFITQNSSNLEVNAIRQTDFLLLKAPSLLQPDFERKVIQDLYAKTNDSFKKLKPNHPGLFYVHSDAFQGFGENDLPSFWTEGVGKAYRNQAKE